MSAGFPPWVVLTGVVGGCVVFGLVERFVHAIVSTIWYMSFGFADGEAKYSFGAMQLVTYTASSSARVLTQICNVLVSSLAGIISWLMLFAVIMFFTGMVYMAYEQYPVMARGLSLNWNSRIGPLLHEILVGPIEVLNLLFKTVLPLYNGVVWIFKRLFVEAVKIPMLSGARYFLQALTETALFTKTLVESSASYAITTFRVCGVNIVTATTNVEDLRCVSDIGARTIDLITPLSHVRQVVGILLMWLGREVCGPLATPLDIITAPLMDINFAKGVHNLVNGVLWMFLQLPILTEARCRMYSSTEGVVMCLPDFEPVFRLVIQGIQDMGRMLDNWMDITMLIAQEVFSPGSAPRCADVPLSTIDVNDVAHKAMFGPNNTVIVGLTETMFAATDGYSTIYYSTAKQVVQQELAPFSWPIPVDVRMGIAAVVYGNSGEQADDQGAGATTSMMGCRLVVSIRKGWERYVRIGWEPDAIVDRCATSRPTIVRRACEAYARVSTTSSCGSFTSQLFWCVCVPTRGYTVSLWRTRSRSRKAPDGAGAYPPVRTTRPQAAEKLQMHLAIPTRAYEVGFSLLVQGEKRIKNGFVLGCLGYREREREKSASVAAGSNRGRRCTHPCVCLSMKSLSLG